MQPMRKDLLASMAARMVAVDVSEKGANPSQGSGMLCPEVY